MKSPTDRSMHRAELEPERADNHLNLGLAYLASGDRVRAQVHFQAALAIEPRVRESIEGALHEADAAGR